MTFSGLIQQGVGRHNTELRILGCVGTECGKPVKCILQPGGFPFTGIGHDTLNGTGPGVPIQFPVFRYLHPVSTVCAGL